MLEREGEAAVALGAGGERLDPGGNHFRADAVSGNGGDAIGACHANSFKLSAGAIAKNSPPDATPNIAHAVHIAFLAEFDQIVEQRPCHLGPEVAAHVQVGLEARR